MKLNKYLPYEIINYISQYVGISIELKNYYSNIVLDELLKIVPEFNNMVIYIADIRIIIYTPTYEEMEND